MAPGSPRDGPIFTYTPWLSISTAFLATIGINAALVRPRAHRTRATLEPRCCKPRWSSTAGKWQRVGAQHHPAFARGSTISARRKVSSIAPTIAGSSNGFRTPSSCSRAPTATRWQSARCRPRPRRPRPHVSRPENLIVLAHYFPLMAEAVARFPSEEWVRGRAPRPASRYSRCARPRRRSRPGARRRRRGDRRRHPEHGTLRQVGIVYGLSKTPGRIQGPVPASATTPTRSARGRRWARADVRGDPVARQSTPGPRRHHRARPRLRGRGTVRHAGARRPRRQRHQGQHVARPVVARHPHRVRRQPRQAQHRHRPQDPRGPAVFHASSTGRRRALEHAAPDARPSPVSTKHRCGRSTPTSSTATPAVRPWSALRLPRQRPDRMLARRRHLRGRRLSATAGRSGASPRSATPATASSRRSA